MRHRSWLGLLGLLLLIILAILIARQLAPPPDPAATEKRDVILLTIDALRQDHLGAYGSALGATPQLDALAQEAVLFADAITPAPLTAAGLASIMTARLPIQHRLRRDIGGQLSAQETTLAEMLSSAGFATAAFSGARIPKGLAQGFDTLSVPVGMERPAQAVVREALAYLEAQSASPSFIWIHISEPRAPWRAPFPWSMQHIRSPYVGEVAAADAACGTLFEGLRAQMRLDGTHMIIIAPTGEALGSEGDPEHGLLLTEPALRVPWLWRLPQDRHAALPRRVAGLAATTDLVPTLLAALGIDAPHGGAPFEGRSLAVCLTAEDPPPRRQLLLETFLPRHSYGWTPLFGLRTADWMLVAAPRARLYDLARDPQRPRQPGPQTEQTLSAVRQALETELARQAPDEGEISAWWSRLSDQPDPYARAPLAHQLVTASRALGAADPERAAHQLAGLSDRFPENQRIRLLEACVDLQRGKLQMAERAFRDILDHLIAACEARRGLAASLLAQRRPEAALSALGSWSPDSLDDCVSLLMPDPDFSARAWQLRGLAEARGGSLSLAAEALVRAVQVASSRHLARETEPLSQAARFLRDVAARGGEIHAAECPLIVRSALQLDAPRVARDLIGRSMAGRDPNDPHLALLDIREAIHEGRLTRAAMLLERALNRSVVELDDCRALCAALDLRGRSPDARDLLERAVPVFPNSAELHYRLALRSAEANQSEAALIHLEKALQLGFNDWELLLARPLRGICRSARLTRYWSLAAES